MSDSRQNLTGNDATGPASIEASSEKDAPLRYDIRLLGRILGDTIRAHEGEAVFEDVERIRRTSLRFHRDADLGERLRVGALHYHHAGRRRGDVQPAYRTVSPDHTSRSLGYGNLPRSNSRSGSAKRRGAHRAAGERRR